MEKSSPKILLFILSFLDHLEDEEIKYSFVDHLSHKYHDYKKSHGSMLAIIYCLWQIIQILITSRLEALRWGSTMLVNYLKIAIRSIKRQKGYAFINITGLAIGMACCILILAFVVDELSYDRFHKKAEQIHRIVTSGHIGGRTIGLPMVPAGVGETLVQDFPEVLASVRLRPTGKQLLTYNDKSHHEYGLIYTDPAFLEIFSFPLLAGNAKIALEAPYSIILTEDIAKKYFGDEDPLGKMLKLGNTETFTITGIIAKPPANSHFSYSMLASFETLFKQNPDIHPWMGWNYYTYLLLDKNVDHSLFEKKFIAFNEQYIEKFLKAAGAKITNYLQPMLSIHLHSHFTTELEPNGNIRYIYTFIAIACFMLILACINFMNLSTARSARRAKEVGLRKVIGARRSMLIKQFLGESLLTVFLSLLLSVAIVIIILPLFNQLANRHLTLQFLLNPWVLSSLLAIGIFVGLIAGSYPALFLSGFHPAKVLKGKLKHSTWHARLRQGLVIFQFSVAITLMISTALVFDQLTYMRQKRLGFEKEQKYVIALQDVETQTKIHLLKKNMNSIDGVIGASGSRMVPGEFNFSSHLFYAEGESAENAIIIETFYCDEDFLEIYDIELAQGRNFSTARSTDGENTILINETAARKLGWTHPVGKRLFNSFDATKDFTIVGMIKDIHYSSVHHTINPSTISFNPNSARRLTLHLKGTDIQATLKEIRKVWEQTVPNRPFDAFFLNDYFNKLYASEERLGKIFQVFAVFTIFIGILGLFGLASYAAEQRTKEIGIRKVLGSSMQSIVTMLCREFMVLVILANIFAWPIAFFMMKSWLNTFPYRTDIRLTTFVLASLMAIGIALLTVSYRALKAAGTNPIKALKYE
ncbi:ABC transporter permease [bacterium]|nr:ABC transporter permease [bacterium]